MPSSKARMKRPGGLIKRGRKCKRFKSEYFDYGKEWFVIANILINGNCYHEPML